MLSKNNSRLFYLALQVLSTYLTDFTLTYAIAIVKKGGVFY